MFNRYHMIFGLVAIAAAAPLAAQTAGSAGAQPQTIARTAVVSDLSTSFKNLDTNKDGNLSQSEVAAAEAKMIQGRVAEIRADMEAQFAKADTNKDGQLSKAEFLAAGPKPPSTAPTGADIIGQLDTNKDGKISLAEFSAERLGDFDSLDTNHDGTLSVAERQAASQQR